MTLSRAEYIARAADAMQRNGEDIVPLLNAERLHYARQALDAVGAYDTYEALGGAMTEGGHFAMCLAGQRGYGDCSSVCRKFKTAISKAEGTEDQRG